VTPSCSNLLERLLDPDPDLRITVEEALQHPWIAAAPAAAAHQVQMETAAAALPLPLTRTCCTRHTVTCSPRRAQRRSCTHCEQHPWTAGDHPDAAAHTVPAHVWTVELLVAQRRHLYEADPLRH
jgi:hypothetical protein